MTAEDKQGFRLTAKDRKILAELFEDSRQPFSAIGRNAGVSKETVAYRVQRMMDSGLLVGFNTVIDIKRTGWDMFFAYVRFRHIDIAQQDKILGYLKKHGHVAQLFECMGNYDAVIKIFARDMEHAGAVMKDIEARLEPYIDEYRIDLISEEAAVPFSFLYETGGRMLYRMERKPGAVALSQTELGIIRALAKDARLGLTEMAEKLKVSRDVLKYHMKKLEKEKIILRYRPDLLPEVLGYNWYFLMLKSGKIGEKTSRALKAFLLNNTNVTYFYRTAGSSDIQVELRVKTNQELQEILLKIRGILKDMLKRSELLTILHEHKYTYFVDCMMQKNPYGEAKR